MTEQSPIVQKALDDLVAELQEKVDAFKDAITTLETAQERLNEAAAAIIDDSNPIIAEAKEWDEMPDSVTPTQLATISVYLGTNEMAEAHFNDPEIRDKMIDKIENDFNLDPAKVQEFNGTVESFMGDYQTIVAEVQQAQAVAQSYASTASDGFSFHTKVVEPEVEGGDWTIVSIPLLVEDGTVSVPETLDEDFVLGGYVAGDTPELSESFNVASFAVPAGQKIEPFVLTTKDDSEAPKYFERVGHWSHTKDTEVPHVHPISETIPIARVDPQQEMLQALMGALGGGASFRMM